MSDTQQAERVAPALTPEERMQGFAIRNGTIVEPSAAGCEAAQVAFDIGAAGPDGGPLFTRETLEGLRLAAVALENEQTRCQVDNSRYIAAVRLAVAALDSLLPPA